MDLTLEIFVPLRNKTRGQLSVVILLVGKKRVLQIVWENLLAQSKMLRD
jgi:hypothetical protein